MLSFFRPDRVIIREVGLCDGLQGIATGIDFGPLMALPAQLSA